MQDTAALGSMEEALSSLYVVLASLKGYSSSEGNRLVVAAVAALERVTQYSPKCVSACNELEGHGRELHLLLGKLADLQDAAASRRREEEEGILRQVVDALERLILDNDPAAAVTAMPGAAQDYEEDEEEEDEDDDPFFMPLPAAIKMADAKQFFVLAQPLTAQQQPSSPFTIVLEPDTPSVTEELSSMLVAADVSTRASSGDDEELSGAGGQMPASAPEDSEAAGASSEADGIRRAAAAAASGAAGVCCAGRDPAAPTSIQPYLHEEVQQPDVPAGGEAAAASPTTGDATPADDKLDQFVDFLHGKHPGSSNLFHEEMRLTMEGCRKLADFISNTGRVRALSLCKNYIGDEGLEILCQGLSSNSSVTALDLPDNDITDAGVAQLSRSLANHPSLTQLQLSNNKIGDMGAVCLAELISSSRNLSKLGLSFNNIGKAGCQALRDAIAANPSLKHLQLLPGNPVTEKEAKALAKALKRNNAFSFRAFLLAK